MPRPNVVAFPESVESTTVSEARELFLERDLSKNTRRCFESDLERFERSFGDRDLRSIAPKDVERHLKGLQNRSGGPASPETVNRHRGTLHNFFAWLELQGLLEGNPVSKVERRRVTSRLPRPLSAGQIGKMFRRIKTHREKALFSLLHRSGLRIQEALSLNIEDVNFRTGTFTVRGKGDRERVGYLSEETKPLLRRYLKTRGNPRTGALFQSRQGRLSYYMARKMFLKAADGITNPDGSQITLHQLRHSFGSERAGAIDPIILRDLMGHSDIRTTLRYSKVNPERTRNAFRDFDREHARG